MSVIVLLLLISVGLAAGFLLVFVSAVRAGQFDDMETPALRILGEDAPRRPAAEQKGKGENLR